jgi:hypothetical protein
MQCINKWAATSQSGLCGKQNQSTLSCSPDNLKKSFKQYFKDAYLGSPVRALAYSIFQKLLA